MNHGQIIFVNLQKPASDFLSHPLWNNVFIKIENICVLDTLVREVFLEPPESRTVTRREKPLVTLDLNFTFMQTPGSGSDPQARIG